MLVIVVVSAVVAMVVVVDMRGLILPPPPLPVCFRWMTRNYRTRRCRSSCGTTISSAMITPLDRCDAYFTSPQCMPGVAVSQQIPTQHIQAITQALRHRIIHHIVSTLSLSPTSLLSEFSQPLTNRDFPSGSDVFS